MKLTDREFGGHDVEMPSLLRGSGGPGGAGDQAGDAGAGGGGGADQSGIPGAGVPGDQAGAGTPGDATSGWAAGLSDADLSANPSLKSSFGHSKDLPDYARNVSRSYLELQKKIGMKGVVAPGKDASLHEVRSFFTEQGCPETPEGYKEPEGFKWDENMPRDEAFEGELKNLLHQVGIEDWRWNKLYPGFVEIQKVQMGRLEKILDDQQSVSMGELKKAWGASYDTNLQNSQIAMEAVFGEDYEQMRQTRTSNGSPFGDNVIFLKGFAKLHEMMGEPNLAAGDFKRRSTFTPNEAKNELNKLMADDSFKKAWTTRDHPEHKEAVQRIDDLHAAMSPEDADKPVGTGVNVGGALTGGAMSRGGT